MVMFKIMVMSDIMNIMNGPDTGAILTQNVIPVISVQPILYQLPYGPLFLRTEFLIIFPLISPSPIGPQKRIPYRTKDIYRLALVVAFVIFFWLKQS